MTLVLFFGLCVFGFLFGLFFSGTQKKPIRPPVGIIVRLKKNRYHLHHWLIAFLYIFSLTLFVVLTDLTLTQLFVSSTVAFFAGWGIQGLFVKDAFNIKNCGCVRCGKRYFTYNIWNPFAKKKHTSRHS